MSIFVDLSTLFCSRNLGQLSDEDIELRLIGIEVKFEMTLSMNKLTFGQHVRM